MVGIAKGSDSRAKAQLGPYDTSVPIPSGEPYHSETASGPVD